MRFSVIVPVYNRPDEVRELLESLAGQVFRDFELIVVEDGSKVTCEEVVRGFGERLDVKYFFKDNSGPGQTRNFGAERARGEYLIILDSDVIVPKGYFEAVLDELNREPADAFGGPDRAHESFTDVQKAISYSMTSFFTTGGIRGGNKKLDKFYPRSFNLGIRREVYAALGGFSAMRFGEDIDLSIRIFEGGYSCRLFPGAWVYHKRRTDFRKFFRQVFNSGIARINLFKRHPASLKLVHLLPSVFTLGCALLLVGALVFALEGHFFAALCSLLPLLLHALLIFSDCLLSSSALKVAGLAVVASYVQLLGYGSGFLTALWRRVILGRPEFDAFKRNFYK